MKRLFQLIAVFAMIFCYSLSFAQQTANIPIKDNGKYKVKKITNKKVHFTIEIHYFKSVDDQYIEIRDKSTDANIIRGRLFNDHGKTFVDGEWQCRQNNMEIRYNGIFEVSDSDDGLFTVKSSELSSLAIKIVDIFKMSGYKFGDASVTILKQKTYDSSYSIIIENMGKIGDGQINTMSANFSYSLLENIGSDFVDKILKGIDVVRFEYQDGSSFSGKIENHYAGNGDFCTSDLREGEKINPPYDKDVYSDQLISVADKLKLIRTFKSNVSDYKSLEMAIPRRIIDDYGYWAIDEYMNNIRTGKWIFKNNDKFEGEFFYNADLSGDSKYVLKCGNKTYKFGLAVKDVLSQDNDIFKLCRQYRNSSDDIVSETVEFSEDLINKFGYWNPEKLLTNATKTEINYKNGDRYIGTKISSSKGNGAIATTLLDGTYYYSTGEKYEGKMNGRWFCGIPVEGKMVMSNGTVLNGNWLKTYNLTEDEITEISKQSSPEDKLQKAKYYEAEKQKVQIEKLEFQRKLNRALQSKISAKDLYQAFDNNEFAASKKYGGKYVAIYGKISSIGDDSALFGLIHRPYLSFYVGLFSSVRCYFDNSDDLIKLSEGQYVTIIGECSSSSARLNSCIVAE